MIILPSSVGMVVNRYKDPVIKQPGWLMESIRPGLFFVARFVRFWGNGPAILPFDSLRTLPAPTRLSAPSLAETGGKMLPQIGGENDTWGNPAERRAGSDERGLF